MTILTKIWNGADVSVLAISGRQRGANAAPAASAAQDVEKFLDGVSSWSADFTQTIDDGHGKVLRSAAGKLYLQTAGQVPLGLHASLRAIGAGRRQADLALRQGSRSRPMCATWTQRLPARRRCCCQAAHRSRSQFDVTALPASGGLSWYQLVPKHTGYGFSTGKNRLRQG